MRTNLIHIWDPPFCMKRSICVLVATSLIGLCGCASHYVMKLSNGMEITTASKPKLRGSTYYFKDAKGREVQVAQSRVLEVEPASMASSENSFHTTAPKKKHWWHFW